MPKRLEIIVRNPGFEGTRDALGAYTIDFDDASFGAALQELHGKLDNLNPSGGRLIARFRNDKGEERGVDLQYYLSHQITDVDTWEPPRWSLPGHGEPPSRES
jgi:hypothetical protein